MQCSEFNIRRTFCHCYKLFVVMHIKNKSIA